MINQTSVTDQTDSLSGANVQTDVLFSMENLTKTKKYTTVKKKKEKKKKHAKGHDAVSGVSDLRSAHM